MSGHQDNHVVYLYRAGTGRIFYVGRGVSPARAEDIAAHNPRVLKTIQQDTDYTIEVAGTYDYATAARVEAALISAITLDKLDNEIRGDGPQFTPLGVDVSLGHRLTEPALTLAQLGITTGGVLLVYLSQARVFRSDTDRLKFDPAAVNDAVVAENIVRWWDLAKLVTSWREESGWPCVLAGVTGPPRRRYVAGALPIAPNKPWTPNTDGHHEVPVESWGEVDAADLRGRLVGGALFDRARTDLFIWIDGQGHIRHQPPRRRSAL